MGNTVDWKKSSFSGVDACVEIAQAGSGDVLVRNSKSPFGSVLVFSSAEWEAFTAGVKQGEFDKLET